jgi:hypothetical protein
MLLSILNKLSNVDVLFSLIGVNKKLDRLARDITFTQSINLLTRLSNDHDNVKLNRFCRLILPQIQHNIQCFTLDSLSIDHVLRVGNYPKLHQLNLVNLPIEMATGMFNGILSIFLIFKYKETN